LTNHGKGDRLEAVKEIVEVAVGVPGNAGNRVRRSFLVFPIFGIAFMRLISFDSLTCFCREIRRHELW
jgi:hypothetical protein